MRVGFQRINHRLQHIVRPQQNVVIPEAQHSIAQCRQMACSFGVRVCGVCVLPTIGFHDQLRFDADEIYDVAANSMLATKLMTK